MQNISLFPWLGDSQASVVVQMSSEDLVKFSTTLIEQAGKEYAARALEEKKEKYLTKEQVKTTLNVCDATLWHWAKKQYLVPVKLGKKVAYLQSDIDRILRKHPVKCSES